MDIKILGSGCTKCDKLEAAARTAAAELGVEAEFEKVTAPAEIASWGVMATPALVIDYEVVLAGRVPQRTTSRPCSPAAEHPEFDERSSASPTTYAAPRPEPG
ncbi:MAG: TM0996/MTH895 family glutaredoxin-like protein [Candidatus Microthrix sp.]|nr:thioredoxin family protein [Candidatus Microthrix sp.]MBK9561325.1 TM0996/MTH895 family glutaredoxin-like protein [Candidatus Microthrix sp.]